MQVAGNHRLASKAVSSVVRRAGLAALLLGVLGVDAALAGTVQLRVRNAVTAQPVSNLTVYALRRMGSEFIGVAQLRTTAQGSAIVELPGVENGVGYVFGAEPYNGGFVLSDDVSAAGEFEFRVGQVPVTVVAGGTNEILAGTFVALYESLSGGTLQWVGGGTTAANGVVVFDPPGLGTGRRFVLEAQSPIDGNWKRSNLIEQEGASTFVVGNAPLNVSLLDAIDGNPLTGASVVVYERVGDSETVVAVASSDGNGQTVFDLDALGEGRTYFLRTWPFGGGPTDSQDLEAAGEFRFLVGAVRIFVERGGSGDPMGDQDVIAFRVLADGSHEYWRSGRSDSAGVVRFDLPGLADGVRYILATTSPVDGSIKYSQEISAPGDFHFTVGDGPLEVVLLDQWSDTPLAGVGIAVAERVGGALQWITMRTTDASGRATFDLSGIGSGRTYVLSAEPYNGGPVFSDDVTSPGEMLWRVGKLEVTVTDGATSQPIPDWQVFAAERKPDGSFEFLAGGLSDSYGIIRFDSPRMNQGAEWVLLAQSPIDGAYKLSNPIVAPQRFQFVVGNAPLQVRLEDGVTGERFSAATIYAFERRNDGQLQYVGAKVTDAAGLATFDLRGLGSGATYVLGTVGYNNVFVLSDDLQQPGEFPFRVGVLQVRVVDRLGNPIPQHPIVVENEIASGEFTPVIGGLTDAAGIVRFDPPDLRYGSPHRLQTISPIDGSPKWSRTFTAEGIVDLTLGASRLLVETVDGLSGAPIAAVGVAVKELPQVEGGEEVYVRFVNTDDRGQASFDLDGLGTGGRFVLESYTDTGVVVRSDTVSAPGEVYLRLGTVVVKLIDADANQPLSNVEIVALRKLTGGGVDWGAQGTTGSDGTVRFDLSGISDFSSLSAANDGPPPAAIYQFRAYDPYGNQEYFFSDAVVSEGVFEFLVSQSSASPFDQLPPTLSITNPRDGVQVPDSGFTLRGRANDEQSIDHVTVVVTDAGGAVHQSSVASYDPVTHTWEVQIAGSSLAAGIPYTVRATAFDRALNQSSDELQVAVVHDDAIPVVTITSHQDGGQVGSSGFLLAGEAFDDLAVSAVAATLSDPVAGSHASLLGVGTDGRWVLAVGADQITEGEEIEVVLVATDIAGKQGSATVRLEVGSRGLSIRHLVDRATFGATPDLLLHAQTLGFSGFLNEQLAPQNIDDSALINRLPAAAPATATELQSEIILRAAYSKRQLLERLTQFWDNHFSTNMRAHGFASLEATENQLFRDNALGNFRTLLEVSSKSPAMEYYLEQAASVVGCPNENYARELLELHTLGVTGPYTEADVMELSRILTGWTVRDGAFYFDADAHDTDTKTFLGNEFPAGGGVEEGERALDIVAHHPATASFLCKKLAVLLVSDSPSAALIQGCAAQFLDLADDPSQIREVVRFLLSSSEFAAPSSIRAKVRNPLGLIVAMVRNLSAETDGLGMLPLMRDMGMELFNHSLPTGFTETSEDWLNSEQILQRARFANWLTRGAILGTSMQLTERFRSLGQVTAEGVVTYLMQLLVDDDYTALEYQTAIDLLTQYGTAPFDLDADYCEERLRQTVATVASFPAYQFH